MKKKLRHWLISDEEALEEQRQAMTLVGSEGDSEDKVEVANNRIYFFSEVKRSSILSLNKEIKKLNLELPSQARAIGFKDPEIELHINSFGGILLDGLGAVDCITTSEIPIHTVINGCAASAATLISVVAPKRSITRHSYALIHQLSTAFWGSYFELGDEVENCNKWMQKIFEIYSKHTKFPKSKLASILKHDLWLDSEECLKYGLVDKIIG